MAQAQRLICSSSEVEESATGFRFTLTRFDAEVPAFVIRYQGKVHGYLNQCGHVPAELDWQPGEFFDDSKVYLICATHGALYSPADGRCLGGRCNGRGLTPLPVEERDGAIYFTPSEQIS